MVVFVGAHPVGDGLQGVFYAIAHRGGLLQKSLVLNVAQGLKRLD